MTDSIRKMSQSAPLRDERYGTLFELAGAQTGLPNLGLAWVVVDANAASPAHFHKRMSEVYHVVEGTGVMVLDGQETEVGPGDCVTIVPGVVHAIKNTSTMPLKFLCATSPSYDPDDDFEI